MTAGPKAPLRESLLSVGLLGRPHGLRGEIVFRPHDPHSEVALRLEKVTLLRSGSVPRDARVASVRPAGATFLLTFDGVTSRDAAAALTLSEVHVDRAVLPPLPPGEFYVEDLPGCEVVGTDGTGLGTVAGTFWNGAHDVITVTGPAGDRMIPVVPDHIISFDGAARRVTVRWPESDDE